MISFILITWLLNSVWKLWGEKKLWLQECVFMNMQTSLCPNMEAFNTQKKYIQQLTQLLDLCHVNQTVLYKRATQREVKWYVFISTSQFRTKLTWNWEVLSQSDWREFSVKMIKLFISHDTEVRFPNCDYLKILFYRKIPT